MYVKDFLDVERSAGESFEVILDHLPIGGEVCRVKAHLPGVGGAEYGVADVDVRPEEKARHVDILLSPVVNKVGEYEVDGFVAGRCDHLLHECRHVVVVLSGHADEFLRGGVESVVTRCMTPVVRPGR